MLSTRIAGGGGGGGVGSNPQEKKEMKIQTKRKI